MPVPEIQEQTENIRSKTRFSPHTDGVHSLKDGGKLN